MITETLSKGSQLKAKSGRLTELDAPGAKSRDWTPSEFF
jgi:hypothetical protein